MRKLNISKKLKKVEQANKPLQRKLTKERKLRRRLYQRSKQVTCLCDRYWFPHRYQFGKCIPSLWDKVALELGCTIKIVNPKKVPF